jgi:hypothetical protein
MIVMNQRFIADLSVGAKLVYYVFLRCRHFYALLFAFMASYFILLAQDKVTKHKSAGTDLGALAHEV